MTEKPTETSLQASSEAKALWERLVNVMSNEEAWAVIDQALHVSTERGQVASVDSLPRDQFEPEHKP